MNISRHLKSAAVLSLFYFPVMITAQERLDMEGTAIRGNRESPKVLYIVPWKSAAKVDIQAPAIVSILDQPLKSIQRRTFRRRIYYHEVIFSSSLKKSDRP